jgi:molybdate transport system substrate-binding protein
MAQHAAAAEVGVLASPGMKEAILDLMPGFQIASGHKVLVTWSGTQNIKKQIAAGEVYDLVIVARPGLNEFVSQGHIIPESRVDVMKSAVGAAVRAGAPKPEIGSGEALKKNLLVARSIGYSSGPSGAHMAKLSSGWALGRRVMQS